jgi:hypothetical protein
MVQFVEEEYMKADEYDAFIKNPTDYMLRTFVPGTGRYLNLLRYDAAFTSL